MLDRFCSGSCYSYRRFELNKVIMFHLVLGMEYNAIKKFPQTKKAPEKGSFLAFYKLR